MKKINLNNLAKAIAEEEGLSKEVNIAQIKEILRIVLAKLGDEFYSDNAAGVIELISKS